MGCSFSIFFCKENRFFAFAQNDKVGGAIVSRAEDCGVTATSIASLRGAEA